MKTVELSLESLEFLVSLVVSEVDYADVSRWEKVAEDLLPVAELLDAVGSEGEFGGYGRGYVSARKLVLDLREIVANNIKDRSEG